MQDEVNGITSGGSGEDGWSRGSLIMEMPPGSLPPLREGREEQAKGQGQDKGPSGTSVFSTPVLWEAKGLRESSAASEQQDPVGW